MSIRETYEPVAIGLRATVEKINKRLEHDGYRTRLTMKENPITELKWNGLVNKRVVRGYRIKVSDISGRINLHCSLEDLWYPQWYSLSVVQWFLEGYLCSLLKDTDMARYTNDEC